MTPASPLEKRQDKHPPDHPSARIGSAVFVLSPGRSSLGDFASGYAASVPPTLRRRPKQGEEVLAVVARLGV